MESMFNLTGRVALVTGSAQGLGFEMAKGLSEAGAHVLVNGRDKDHVANAVSLIKSSGGSAQELVFDVSADSARAAALSTIASEHDRLDILINNVGLRDRRSIEEIDGPDFQALLQVNLTSAFLLCREVVGLMRTQQWGRIVNIASTTVPTGRPNYLHYITSKSAMIGMTRSMARELGTWNITVHLFMPGAVETEIERPSVSGAMFETLAKQQAIQRPAEMEEYAGFMLFLCSDDSEFTTGQTFAANGGIAFP